VQSTTTTSSRPRRTTPSGLSENQIQRAVFQHLRTRSASGVFAFHPANGGYRRPVEAAIFKGLGVVAGTPDVIVVRNGQCYALELKTEKGKLTDKQKAALAALEFAGATCGVAYGLDDALAWLENRGLLRGSNDSVDERGARTA
jgi:hypothetical protein